MIFSLFNLDVTLKSLMSAIQWKYFSNFSNNDRAYWCELSCEKGGEVDYKIIQLCVPLPAWHYPSLESQNIRDRSIVRLELFHYINNNEGISQSREEANSHQIVLGVISWLECLNNVSI